MGNRRTRRKERDDTKGIGKSAAMISQMHLNVSAFPTVHFIGEKKSSCHDQFMISCYTKKFTFYTAPYILPTFS